MTEDGEQRSGQQVRASEDGHDATEDQRSGGEPVPARTSAPLNGVDERAPLFEGDDAQRLRERWELLQVTFVDQPRQAVEQADELVGELMERLTTGFSQRRAQLEAQWERGDEASTEDLRVAFTRYRSFFNRLLAA
jgi:hypothetical protein